MPHFTLPIDAAGPLVNAVVSVSEARRTILLEKNLPIPDVRIIRALVDTGASFTMIEPTVINELSLSPTGTIEIVTPSTGQDVHTTETYDIDFAIYAAEDDPPLLMPNLRVATAELFLKQGIHALIGRDVLKRFVLIYNGSINQFSLCF
jgi:hypothetical protein